MNEREDGCTEAEWQAFWKMGQIKEIAEPGFAYRAKLAHEEGLLGAILAGREEEVKRRVSGLLDALAAQVRWRYPPKPSQSDIHSDQSSPSGPETHVLLDKDHRS